MKYKVLKQFLDESGALVLSDCTYAEHHSKEFLNGLLAHGFIKEIKDTKGWRADRGDKYWYIDDAANNTYSYEDNDYVDNEHYDTGNYFKTEEEAEKHVEWLKAMAVIKRSSDFVPDWEDENQKKYYVYYDCKGNELMPSGTTFYHETPLPYYATIEDAQYAIADPEISKAYLTVFGVEK